MDHALRQALLEDLLQCVPLGAEPDDAAKDVIGFLPRPCHARALDPSVFVVQGGPGAGKTRLFDALQDPVQMRTIAKMGRGRSLLELDRCAVVAGFASNHRFPSEGVSSTALDAAPPQRLRAFWTGLLVAMTLRDDTVAPVLRDALGNAADAFEDPRRVATWLPLAQSAEQALSSALDAVDSWLQEQDRWLFVAYDGLDRLCLNKTGRAAVRDLVTSWLGQVRRRTRIIPKLFLDDREFDDEILTLPDGPRLAQGHVVRLDWDPVGLYRLLFKRMANGSDRLREFLSVRCEMNLSRRMLFGWMPPDDEDLPRRGMSAMVGPMMGSVRTRCVSHAWVPNHILDAFGHSTPRTILTLFAKAAEAQLAQDSPPAHLLAPACLEGARLAASEARLRELGGNHAWIGALGARLVGAEVPMEQSEFTNRVGDIESRGTGETPRGSALIDKLLRMGVVRRTEDNRIHVPDIYLFGFGLKRKGGIRRPKRVGG